MLFGAACLAAMLVPGKSALAASYQLSGRVTDAASAGIAAATVDVLTPGTTAVVATAQTATTGDYAVTVEEGTYDVRVTPPAGSGFRIATVYSEEIFVDEVFNIALVPSGYAVLSGRVFGPLGEPLPGVAVTLDRMPWMGSYTAITDASGAYSLPAPAGDYNATVYAYDTSTGRPYGTFYVRGHVSLSADTAADVHVPGAQMTVRAVGADGAPVAGASVYVTGSAAGIDAGLGTSASYSNFEQFGSLTTDASGEATLWVLPTAGASSPGYRVSVTPPEGNDYSPQTVSGIQITAATTIIIAFQNISNPPVITTVTLPATTVGAAYLQAVAATGGTAPYAWAITFGALPNGMTLDAATGVIAGTPDIAGNYDFTVQVTDANGSVATQDLTIVVNAAPFIETSTLADLTVGGSVTRAVAVTGGTAPLAWSVTSGALPAGLALDAATGEISGAPTTTEVAAFTVTATDVVGISASAELTLTVNAAPAIVTSTLAAGTVGATYSQTVAVTGGTAPLAWSVTSGALPAGLALDATTGEISGAPTATEVSAFTVTATDANGVTASVSLGITVNPAVSFGTSGALAGATVGQPYAQTISATGGTGPLTWSVTSGALPAGLALDAATGAISGTPTVVGTYNFTVQVTDANAQAAEQAQSIVVSDVPVITTMVLPDATETGAYAQIITVSGGTAPYAWSVTSGALPAGLALDAATGAISGTPTVNGTYTFTVTVTEAYGLTAAQPLTLIVRNAPVIHRPSLPDGRVGKRYSQSIHASGGASPLTWSITSGALPAGLALDAVTGLIAGQPTEAAIAAFTVTVTDASGVSSSMAYTLTINPSNK